MLHQEKKAKRVSTGKISCGHIAPQTRTKTVIETPCNDLQHNISSAHVTVLSSSFRLQQDKVVEDCEDGGGLAGREFVHAAPDRQTPPEADTRCSLDPCSLSSNPLNICLAENFSDVTFKLPDGSSVPGHRLILAIASPFFEAQFYGRSLIPESNSECIFPCSCRHM